MGNNDEMGRRRRRGDGETGRRGDGDDGETGRQRRQIAASHKFRSETTTIVTSSFELLPCLIRVYPRKSAADSHSPIKAASWVRIDNRARVRIAY